MDAKDLRTESALSERNNDGSKYCQSGGIALHCDRNKPYQDIGSNSLAKVDVQNARPCAVIGPDRVVPPSAPNDAYLKKGPTEPWQCMDNAYHTRRPPEYPHKLANFQNPTRNISPRQTFQENMQRIMVPPSYNSVKISDDSNYVQMSDRNNALPKNIKINVPPEAKFCDVPYTVYPTNNEQKNVRNAEMCIPSVNPTITRTAPHGWPPGSVNIRPTRSYGAPELYQYQEFPSCAGPRPVVPRPNRTVPEEAGYVYTDPFYHQEGNIRFKPYPTVKDRFPQQRYEYISNYANSFHPPPPFPNHKYELQKPVPPHPYPPYPPIKYVDRVPEPVMEGYQRNQQGNYNIPYRNQIIHPNYGQVLGNSPQNKLHSYPPDAHIKAMGPNKLPFENTKTYIEYDNGRPKMYPPSEGYLVNEMGRVHSMKSQVIMPNYPTINMHNIPPNTYYKKDNQQIKNYEYLQPHFRSMDPNLNIHNPMIRHPPVFSPNTSAISPTDSSTSNDNSQTLGISQEDCGYVSQSSTASARSVDSGINRIQNDYYRKYYDSRYAPIIRTPMMAKSELNANHNSKEKKNIDVRQFLQMWNEGDEETEDNSSKEIIIQSGPKSDSSFIKAHEVISQPNQEQLYVLGLVNVPSEELDKYEHIQKVSKLPENIKGYNHIELLNQFEEAIESSNMTNYKTATPKDFQITSKVISPKQTTGVVQSRPLSPLDVEAKISQSVIHKEVGCNFEIKPCSPKMLNVEVATPVQNILAERAIEKVANPVMLKSPRLNGMDENIDCNIMKRKDHRININTEPVRIPSCKMVKTQFSNNVNSLDSIKNSYSLQDLESNSGLCLASLPRLDNDIELNFPEVNQQFINANKGDSIVSTSLRDLPNLELLDQSDSQIKEKRNDISTLIQVNDVLKSPCLMDSESEFSKLSKYRKTKTLSSDSKENQSHMTAINAARTDSVIIKNPENTKNHEEKNTFSPKCSNNKQACDIQQAPINLTSHTVNQNKSPIHIKQDDASQCNNTETPAEIAIDFSLNRNSSIGNDECMELKKCKDTKSLTHSTIVENNSLLDDNFSKLPILTDCDQHIQDSFTNNNKIYNTDIPSPVKYSQLETEHEIAEAKAGLNLIENPLEDISTQSKCILHLPTDKEVTHVNSNSHMSPIANINEISNDSNSLPPIEFATTATDLLPIDSVSRSILVDIDNHKDTMDTHLPTSNINLIENNLDENTLKEDPNFENRDDSKDIMESVTADEEMDTYASQDTIDQAINSPVIKKPNNEECNNCNFTKDPHQINDMKQNDANSDLATQNTVTSRQNDFQTKSNEINTDITLPSRTVVTHTFNDLPSEAIERDSNIISSSPNSTSICDLSDPARQELKNSSDLLCSENIVTNSEKEEQPVITESNADYNIPCQNNITLNISDDYHTDIPEQVTNRVSSPLNISIEDEKDTHMSSDQQPNLELPSPSTIATYDTTDDATMDNITTYDTTNDISMKNPATNLLEDLSGSPIAFTSNKDIHCEDFNENNGVETRDIIKVSVEKGKLMNLRYLSYGSKEMYSPWIQKLVLFCEGNINILNNKTDELPTDCAVVEKANQVEKFCDFEDCNREEDYNTTNNSFQCNENSIITDFKNNTSDTEDLCDLSTTTVTKEDTNVDIDNICNNYCKSKSSTDDEDISDSRILGYINTDAEKDVIKSPVNSIQTDDQIFNNNISDISTDLLTKDVEDPHEKLDVLSSFKEIERCLSPEDHEKWDSRSNSSIKTPEQRDKHFNSNNEITEQWDNYSDSSDDVPKQLNETSTENNSVKDAGFQECDGKPSDDTPKQLDRQIEENDVAPILGDKNYTCNDTLSERPEIQTICSNDLPEEFDKQSNCSANVPVQWDQQLTHRNEISNQSDQEFDDNNITPDQWTKESNSIEIILPKSDKQAKCTDLEAETATRLEEDKHSYNKITPHNNMSFNKKRQRLKRSLSDSALNVYNNKIEHTHQENEENDQFIWPVKRKKIIHDDILAQDLCNIIQSNRRNSISAIYNEENVSFCILIDNGCIITEEENEEQEKICYTELPEESLAEIENDSTNDEENIEALTKLVSDNSAPQLDNDCEYSDSFIMHSENENLGESWVEDIACVETVISDDIAADIEISEPISPKDDMLSDNDESGVFSSSEHTDKVRYIYGDKMCNDDAQFVQTLYNTPQMDVKKTLVQRESLTSGEYYDNDSLEKILSESNDQVLSPYVPEHSEPVFSTECVNGKETVEDKENMAVEIISPLQNKISALDVMDAGIDKIHHEDVKLCELFNETQDDTVHSCESSVDNVFTYKENDENTNYTSSSPEVSSTTSEDKKSAILLKITSYQGSRISQVNDINRDNKRSSCKFTEDKGYVQSQSNFPTHRPLLTKAAQKYIPPLKETMRDLKVKLSLPQHSLMKLKQLKNSKDEPKVSKQNLTVPRVPKKPKPKFEDVLKSIDEIQIKMHKERSKKSKKTIPKVVIKKNENGSHYASTSNKEFNPDLTGRKWQPWVFIEKNHFIDKMAIKKKTKAVYSHRKRMYVLAEKFQKYKSVNSAKFVISPPISNCPTTGLKYTIRLKHNY